MRKLIAIVLALVSGVASAVALYHLMRTGTCASGGPYVSARPCPSGTGGQIMLLTGGIIGMTIACFVGADMFGVMFGLIFLSLGGAFLYSKLHGHLGPGADTTTLILAITFIPMGAIPFFFGLRSLLSGGGGSSSMFSGGFASISPGAMSSPLAGLATAPRITTTPFVPTAPRPAAAPSPPASDSDPLARIGELAKLHSSGALSDEEFAQQKAKLLAQL